MRKYLTPPFCVWFGCIVALAANIAAEGNGLYSDDTGVVINRVVLIGGLSTLAYLYKRNPDWDPIVIKAKAAKAKKRAARAQRRQAPRIEDEKPVQPRKPSGW